MLVGAEYSIWTLLVLVLLPVFTEKETRQREVSNFLRAAGGKRLASRSLSLPDWRSLSGKRSLWVLI